MHATVDHKKILTALELAARASVKHPTLPVLQCVQLVLQNNTLYVRATNLDLGIETTLPVSEGVEGMVCVPSAPLLQIISLSTEPRVTLAVEDHVLLVQTPSGSTKLHTVSSDDFPNLPTVSGEGQRVIGVSFALGLKTAAFAASQSSIKPELCSVYVHQKQEHTLTFAATDSFRLLEKTVSQKQIALERGVLIPTKNAMEIARTIESFSEDPQIFIEENQCALRFENGTVVTSRLVAGNFPDYEGVIPKEFSTHTTLLTADLQHALKKTGVFLNKFSRVTLAAAPDALTVSSETEGGTTNERIPATTEGEPLTLNFNQRYIQDVLPHITDQSITIHFAGVGRPIVIEGVHDQTLRYLVMPMNK
jgi:DNA polymerase-3 subunit beta